MSGCHEILFEFVSCKLESAFSGTAWNRTIPERGLTMLTGTQAVMPF